MTKAAQRGLDSDFLKDLQQGLLAPLLGRIKADRSLCLELRENYVNVYYRGGSLMRLSKTGKGYASFFDPKYLDCSGLPLTTLPGAALRQPGDVAAWVTAMPSLKEAMDLFLGKHAKEEREIQQLILRDNNLGTVARSTDYYVCDIEYANDHGRFDLIAVRWPSTSTDRKNQHGMRLVLGEVKFGDGALDGTAGLHSHVIDVNSYLADPQNLENLKSQMLRVFNQKRSLGLVECEKDLLSFSNDLPMLLLVLVNHDPAKSKLRDLLRTLPPSPHAELRIATACLLGYGLYDPGILTVDQALARFEACI